MAKRQGFTLIEMTIVLFIISLLVLIVLPNLNGQRKRAQEIHRHAMVTVVQGQVTAYLDEYPHGHPDLSSLQKTGYLSEQQVKQAQQEGITIQGDRVHDQEK